MRKRPKIYISWKAAGIVLLLYVLFLTGFSFGARLTPNTVSAVVFSAEDEPARQEPSEGLLVIAKEKEKDTKNAGELTKQAVVYCTHTSEGYQGEKRTNGKPGGVLQGAKALAEELEAQGIGVILLEDVFDAPDWNNAYGNSLAALERVKRDYPDIELFIDVHRDSKIDGLNTHLASSGVAYARMMLIIGSNANLPHPNWKSNEAFADSLHDQLDAMVPGIMRDPKIYSGRYNQHMGTKAILVEVGSEDNTVDEAKASAKLLAEALCEIL